MRMLQILGTGCPKCQSLAENAETAAKALGLEYEIEKVTDINEIISYGVVATPALVVDGIVKVSARVPAAEELKVFLE